MTRREMGLPVSVKIILADARATFHHVENSQDCANDNQHGVSSVHFDPSPLRLTNSVRSRLRLEEIAPQQHNDWPKTSHIDAWEQEENQREHELHAEFCSALFRQLTALHPRVAGVRSESL